MKLFFTVVVRFSFCLQKLGRECLFCNLIADLCRLDCWFCVVVRISWYKCVYSSASEFNTLLASLLHVRNDVETSLVACLLLDEWIGGGVGATSTGQKRLFIWLHMHNVVVIVCAFRWL